MSRLPLTPSGGALRVGAVADQQVVLDEAVEGLEVGRAVFAEQDETAADRTLPIEKDIAPQDDVARAQVFVVVGVGILDHDVTGGVVVVAAAAGGEIVEEDVALDDHVVDAVDVDVLVGAVLVVEQIADDPDVAGAVVHFKDVVVEAVVQDVVAQRDAAGFGLEAVLDLDHQGRGTGAGMGDVEAFDGDAGDVGVVVVDGEHGLLRAQPGHVGHGRTHGHALRKIAADADASGVQPGRDFDGAQVRHPVQRVGDGRPRCGRGAAGGRVDAVGGDVEGLLRLGGEGARQQDGQQQQGQGSARRHGGSRQAADDEVNSMGASAAADCVAMLSVLRSPGASQTTWVSWPLFVDAGGRPATGRRFCGRRLMADCGAATCWIDIPCKPCRVALWRCWRYCSCCSACRHGLPNVVWRW